MADNRGISYRGFKTAFEYYRANKWMHKLTRSELAALDFGLYRTLLREGMLEKAISEKHGGSGRPSKSQETIDMILIMYMETGDIEKTSRRTKSSPSTVRKYLTFARCI